MLAVDSVNVINQKSFDLFLNGFVSVILMCNSTGTKALRWGGHVIKCYGAFVINAKIRENEKIQWIDNALNKFAS